MWWWQGPWHAGTFSQFCAPAVSNWTFSNDARISKERKIPQPLLVGKRWNQKLKPLFPKTNTTFPWKPAEKGGFKHQNHGLGFGHDECNGYFCILEESAGMATLTDLHQIISWELTYCGVQNYSVSGFIIFELFTVFFFQDWAGWGIFTVIPGNPRGTKGDSQHLEARPELQDWLRSELFTVKNYRTGPFSKYLGNNFELYSKRYLLEKLHPLVLSQKIIAPIARKSLREVPSSQEQWRAQKLKFPRITVRFKIITGSLVTLENLFPDNYRYRYRLEIRMNYH